jgi:hypothetical protein
MIPKNLHVNFVELNPMGSGQLHRPKGQIILIPVCPFIWGQWNIIEDLIIAEVPH